MRNTSPQLRILVAIVYAACFAHALPSQQLGPGLDEALGTSTAEGPAVELDSIPERPSESLLKQMTWHNRPLSGSYQPWNITDLDEQGCRELANRLSNEATADATESSCTPSYSCNWDRLRYPHWLVFVNCSKGPCDSSGDSVCLAYEDWMVVVRFFEVDRSSERRSARSTGEAEGKQPPKGEWRLRRIPLNTECSCLQ